MVKKKEEIKAVAFDIGGVLQLGAYIPVTKRDGIREHNMGVHEYLSKKFKKDLDSWFDSIDTTYGKSMDGTITRKKAIKDLAKNLGTSQDKLIKLFHKAYKKGFKKNKKLFQVAKKLQKKGYEVGILSDQWYLSSDILTSKRDMEKFSPVIISCFAGVRKPAAKIYKMYVQKSKYKAKEIVFVDNREWNLKPARKLGMKTVLFEDNKQTIRDLKKLGVDV